MLIDMFTYYNERELLEFHINHAAPYVDKIIVIEGDRTYDGRPYTSDFDIKHPKVEYHLVPLLADPLDRWENEGLQRRTAGNIAKAYPGTVFLTCVDEIIHPAYYMQTDKPLCLSLQNYYYYFNGKDIGEKPDHPMPICLPTDQITNLQAQWEDRHDYPVIPEAGWHFSYLGGVERIKQKLEAFSHIEFDTAEVKDNLAKNIAAGQDIFGRPDHRFEFVPIDDSFPEELVNNQEKYKDLIWLPQ